jgi:hypothetical protein
MGSYQFTDLEAKLVAPVIGEQMGTKIAFVGDRMEFEVRGRLNSTERTASGGSSVAAFVTALVVVTRSPQPTKESRLDLREPDRGRHRTL